MVFKVFTFPRPSQLELRQNAQRFHRPYRRTWLENRLEDNLPTWECLKGMIQHPQVDGVSNKLLLYKPQAASNSPTSKTTHTIGKSKILVSLHQLRSTT